MRDPFGIHTGHKCHQRTSYQERHHMWPTQDISSLDMQGDVPLADDARMCVCVCVCVQGAPSLPCSTGCPGSSTMSQQTSSASCSPRQPLQPHKRVLAHRTHPSGRRAWPSVRTQPRASLFASQHTHAQRGSHRAADSSSGSRNRCSQCRRVALASVVLVGAHTCGLPRTFVCVGCACSERQCISSRSASRLHARTCMYFMTRTV